MKVNLGCGTSYRDGWVNVDAYPGVKADIYSDAFEFVSDYGPEVTELYMGHMLEHMLPASAVALLTLMRDRLAEGAVVSAVVPDMRAIFAAYDAGEITNAELNERFVYSYEQPSHHVWCYDADSLARVFEEAGFVDVEAIDPLTWEPVWWKSGPESRWQCGVRATVSRADGPTPASPSAFSDFELEQAATDDLPVTADAVLLERIRQLRKELDAALASGASGSPAAPGYRPSSRAMLRAALVRGAPEGSRGRDLLRLARLVARDSRTFTANFREHWRTWGISTGAAPPYPIWVRAHDAHGGDLVRQREFSGRAPDPISVHCIVRARPDGSGVQATLRSLEKQTWTHWTATVIGAADPSVANGDARVTFEGSDTTFAETINRVATQRPGRDMVLSLDAGDRLAPDCCFHVATKAWRDPLVELVYWDDDRIDSIGIRSDPRFRPSWSPETLLGANYLGRSFAMRARRFEFAGGLGDAAGGAAEWDLLLRCDLDASRVARVPRLLSHLSGPRPEPTPTDAVRVVSQHLERAGIAATATYEAGTVRLQWDATVLPHVTVVIPTRHNRTMLERCLPSLAGTDYPDFDVIVVDNGGRTEDRDQWYRDTFPGLDLRVEWWDRPFNYSAVNNAAAREARGEVLVFLNDDTEMPDPAWLRELVGWAVRPELGIVGMQLIGPDGAIQHGGVIVGLNGFADHLFEGMPPGSSTLLGPTGWYRNVMSVTAACVAIRRDLFEELGGFDERFILCGSDVVLGLDAVLAGKRNLCIPFGGVRHLESATRGTDVPPEDFFASYWRYQRWLFAGDPYFSPNLSLESRTPRLRPALERTSQARISAPLGRQLRVFRQQGDSIESEMLADQFRVTDADVRLVQASHEANAAPFAPRTVNWFLPDIDSPFYGGYNTALRIADHLARTHGVQNRFVVWSAPNEQFFRSALAAAFPALAGSLIVFHDASRASLDAVPECDVAIATLWATAYSVAQFPHARRRAYLIQDFEPMFYPAGTLYALAEESYRLGLYGLCNTEHMLRIYRERYGGRGESFMPALDTSVFYADGSRDQRTSDDVATVFVYSRPGHWRNCWELASIALEQLKDRLGDRVRIVTAGSWARPEDLTSGVEHLGLLDYRETGNLYRSCDVGVALTVSEHPSYLPLELMACGVPVVAFDNPAGYWLLRDGENSLLCRRSADSLTDALERLVRDPELGRRLSRRGLQDIAEGHGSWEKALAGVYEYLSDPERA
ncbi:MAG: rhamnosyltransferase WsaF family glycosyltransferase [Acidimicrobiia bacterium]